VDDPDTKARLKRIGMRLASIRRAPGRLRDAATSAWHAAHTSVQNAISQACDALVKHGFNRSFNLALAIALVATFAVTTSYSASQWELRASGCDRALGETTTYELVREQMALSRGVENERWRSDYSARISEGRRLLDQATGLRRSAGAPAGRANPDALDVDAQIEFVSARTIRAVRDFTAPAPAEPDDVRETILRERCPHVGTQDDTTGTSVATSTIGARVRHDVTVIRDRTVRDAVALLLFVIALALFTAADAIKYLALPTVLTGGAVIVALTGVGVAVVSDDALPREFAIGIVLYALLAWLAYMIIVHLGVRDSERTDGSNVPFVSPDAEAIRQRTMLRRFRSTIVILITIASLLNGLAGVLYTGANGAANEAAANAAALQFQMLRTSSRFQAKAYSAIARMTQVRDAHLRLGAVRTIRSNGVVNAEIARDASLWNRDEIRWSSLVERLEAATPYSTDLVEAPIGRLVRGSSGPYRDAAYPEPYFIDQTVQRPAQLYALRDAYDEQSVAWDERASGFLGTLAMLAIAAYLFGESLRSSRTRGAYVLTTFGIGLVFAGIVFGTGALTHRIPPYDDAVRLPDACAGRENRDQPRATAASLCFAAAELHAKKRRAPEALARYEWAAALRPGFSVARYLAVVTRIASPKTGPLQNAIAEERALAGDMAAAGTAIPEQLLESLGYHEYLYAIETSDRSSLRAALMHFGDAKRAVLPNLPPASLLYRFGAASLANGDPANARVQFDIGASLFTMSLGERRATEPHAAEDAELAGSAIADLERLRARCTVLPWSSPGSCTGQAAMIDDLESSIVATTWSYAMLRSRLVFPDRALELAVTPGGIGWRLPSGSNQANARAVLVFLAYRWDSSRQMWVVLPDLTYQVDGAKLYRSKRWVSGYRSRLIASDYAGCLDLDSTYRLELYRDGKRIARKDVKPARSARFSGIRVREPGVAFCIPNDWVRAQVDPEKLAARFVSPTANGRRAERGAAVFAFFASRNYGSPIARATNERLAIRRAVDVTLRQLGRPRLGAGGFRESSSRCSTYFDENWTSPHVDYTSDTMTVLGKAWETLDGLIQVGIVWQGRGSADALSCNVLTSMTSVDRDAPAAARATPPPAAAASPPAFTYR
jgi:hypothetical protein